MSVTATARTDAVLAGRDQLTLALDRAAGARPIDGNRLQHFADSPRALDAMLAAIVAARRWVHFENYIIRDDATGQRFARALAERAHAGVGVRVLYDALGSFGTSRCEVAPRQRSSTAATKCWSWPAATDGTVAMVASLRGN